MPNSKRQTILNEAEVADSYNAPSLSLEEKRNEAIDDATAKPPIAESGY